MSSLLFWLFLHSISVRGGRHYLFWPSLFVLAITVCSGHNYFILAVTTCSGRHYLLTKIEWRNSQNNNDNICLLLCLLFLICSTASVSSHSIEAYPYATEASAYSTEDLIIPFSPMRPFLSNFILSTDNSATAALPGCFLN